jgi:hypothetical protein
MNIPYNTSIKPPAPFVPVHVSNLADIDGVSVSAKIDTGADISAIPAALIDRLNLTPAGEIVVEGYNGVQSTIYCYDVILRVDQLQMVGLSTIAFAEDYVLLGRDVLNLMRVLLDGPAFSTEVTFPLNQ